MQRTLLGALVGMIVVALAGFARADVEVSLEIEGTPEEIMAILSLLKANGFAGGGEEAEALKVEVHSVAEGAEKPAAPPAETGPDPKPKKPAEPPLQLVRPGLTPSTTTPGESVVVRVQVVDQPLVVDTVAALLVGEDVMVDLRDNGQDPDRTANDGTWSATMPVPADLSAGDYTVYIVAFNANGDRISLGGEGEERRYLEVDTVLQVESGSPAP